MTHTEVLTQPSVFVFIRCLVHLLRNPTLKYTKIRQYSLQCQLDLCRHAMRYGCQREEFCFFAHSFIELQVWVMQCEQGLACRSTAIIECRQQGMPVWSSNSFILSTFQVLHMKLLFRRQRGFGILSTVHENRYTDVSSNHTFMLVKLNETCLYYPLDFQLRCVSLGAAGRLEKVWPSQS